MSTFVSRTLEFSILFTLSIEKTYRSPVLESLSFKKPYSDPFDRPYQSKIAHGINIDFQIM